jgi:hypothetical protein
MVVKPFAGDDRASGKPTPTTGESMDRVSDPSEGLPSSPSGSSSSDPAGGLAPFDGCLLALAGARCPTTPECFSQLIPVGRAMTAKSTPCTSRHSWETFLLADLPSDVVSSNYNDVKKSTLVSVLCTSTNLSLSLGGGDTSGWSVDVLPPNAPAFASGNRVFRCVAGRGRDSLNKSYFGNE